jgi:predicted esterase
VTVRTYEGMGHTVINDEIQFVRALLSDLVAE